MFYSLYWQSSFVFSFHSFSPVSSFFPISRLGISVPDLAVFMRKQVLHPLQSGFCVSDPWAGDKMGFLRGAVARQVHMCSQRAAIRYWYSSVSSTSGWQACPNPLPWIPKVMWNERGRIHWKSNNLVTSKEDLSLGGTMWTDANLRK